MITETILQHSPELLSVQRSFETHLKGIAQPMILYAIDDMRGFRVGAHTKDLADFDQN